MNIKSNKGYVGIDVSIAVIVLLILIPTIMGIVYNLNHSKNSTEIKSYALNILTNSIEASKGIKLDELNERAVLDNIMGYYHENGNEDKNMTINADNKSASIMMEKFSFKIELDIKDYNETNNSATENTVKTVKAKVTYKLGADTESMELSTVVK